VIAQLFDFKVKFLRKYDFFSLKMANYDKSPHLHKVKAKNININYGSQNIDNSVKYKGETENTVIYEKFSRILIQKYGDKKLGITGAISLITGVIQLLIWPNSLSTTKIYPPQIQGSWILCMGILFFMLGAFLIGVVVYFQNSKCKSCHQYFAYSEFEKPDVEEVKAHDGYHITTKRKYKCKFCGDIKNTEETEVRSLKKI